MFSRATLVQHRFEAERASYRHDGHGDAVPAGVGATRVRAPVWLLRRRDRQPVHERPRGTTSQRSYGEV